LVGFQTNQMVKANKTTVANKCDKNTQTFGNKEFTTSVSSNGLHPVKKIGHSTNRLMLAKNNKSFLPLRPISES
jgi:hypothetical protein